MLAQDGLDHLIELLKEPRSVPLLDRRWSARYLSRAAQVRQQVSSRKDVPDVGLREGPSGRTEDPRPLLQAPTRQRKVGGDHDVAGLHVLDDPIIGRVESILHDPEREPWFSSVRASGSWPPA